jgi:putative DNA-binding protein
MSSLSELQEALQDYVLSGGAQRLLPLTAPGPRGNHAQRLRIYYDGYRLRLCEALASDFEALCAALGADGFRDACLAYIAATPSVYRNVRWYGARFPDFLARAASWADQPWIADLAYFEWTLTLAFDAVDTQSLAFHDLAALPAQEWTDLRLAVHPSLHLLPLSSNAPAIRIAVDAGTVLPMAEMHEQAVHWAVWRKEASVHFRSLTEAEQWALDAIRADRTFAEICAGLCHFAEESEAPALAAAFLRRWVEDGMIAGSGCKVPVDGAAT